MFHSYSDAQIKHVKVLFAGVCSLILSMGIARFAYTPMLPVMMQQAHLSHEGGGWLAAINYAGYLTGVFVASWASDAVIKDRLYRWGMVVAVVSTAMMAWATDFTVWAVSRYIAGLTSAAGLMLGSGLILNWLVRHNHRRELGIHFSGIGFGIALPSAAAIFMVQTLAWSTQWWILAGLGSLLLLPALGWFPSAPNRDEALLNEHPSMQHAPPNAQFMRLFTAAYFCAGFGYVVTATFIVAIVNAIPALVDKGSWVFLVIGLVAAPSCILWDIIARRIGHVNALIMVGAIEVIGIITPTFGWGLTGAIISAVLYGATAIAIVSLTLTMAGRYYPAQPAKMMGKMTIAYGIAQMVAPAITGWFAGAHESYEVGLYLAAGVMTIGTTLFYLMRKAQ